MFKGKFKIIVALTIMLTFLFSPTLLAEHQEPELVIDIEVSSYIDYFNDAALHFKDYVEAASEGRIHVEIHPGEAIGSNREVAELINLGEYDMSAHTNEEMMSYYVPEVEVINMPFLIENQMVGHEVWQGEFFDEINTMLQERTNLRLLDVGKNSIRRSYFQEPITSPSDIREHGLTMRTMEIPMHIEIWEATGADVVTVSGDERYEALDTGMMDGLEGGVASTRDVGVFPLIDYIVMTDHMMSFSYWYANDDFWTGLSDEFQEIVENGVQSAVWHQRVFASQATQEVLKTLPEEYPHIEILYPSAEDFEEWREVTMPVAREFVEEIAGEEFVEWTIEQVEKAEEEVGRRRDRMSESY